MDNLHTIHPSFLHHNYHNNKIILHNYSALFTLFSPCFACYLSITLCISNSLSLLPGAPKMFYFALLPSHLGSPATWDLCWKSCQSVVVLTQFATKNHAVTLSLLPSPWWDGEENQKEKGKKLAGWDENSLTEWQREKKTSVILIKSIYNMQCSHHPMPSLLLSSKSPSFSQLPT